MKGGAAILIVLAPQLSTVGHGDRAADGKAKTQSVFFGREERLEDALRIASR